MVGLGKIWHIGLILILATGCGESHSADDDAGTEDSGTEDSSTDTSTDVLACPPVLPETCVRGACCNEDPREAERIPGTCNFECPDGWVSQSLCDVGPECDIAACAGNEDCQLAWDTCCGVCSTPTLDDYDAINSDAFDAHREMVCPEPVPCPRCAEGFNPNLGASCQAGTCEGYDLSTLALTECTEASDCRVRTRDCCECGADTSFFNLMAIRADGNADYEALVCPSDSGCLECAPVYPEDVVALCNAEGRCELAMTDTTE